VPTARDFITLALKEAGVVGVGQTPLDEDINDCFILLKRMLSQWQRRRWIVPNLIDICTQGNSQRSNLIGPGQYWNTARPDKIQAAYFKQLTGGGSFDSGFSSGFNNLAGPNNDVTYPLFPIWSYEDYATKVRLKDLNTWPQYYFYDAAFPYGNVFIWPIPDQSYEIHLILKGPIGFTIELKCGVIENQGAQYVDGTYESVPFVNLKSFGSGGTANVTVLNGAITEVTIADPGDGYKINDKLTFDNSSLGGAGAGFVWEVTQVTSDLDAEFNMPPEYEEAIHYNLCVRITSMYQYPANPVQGKLAILALNTIKNANFQVSKLQMPSALQGNSKSNFYIFNADQM
jgi:hypothetical protein